MPQPSTATTARSRRLLQSVTALRHRNYRLYWIGQRFSVLAHKMEGVAQSWGVLLPNVRRLDQ